MILQNEAQISQVCHAPLHSHYLGQPGSSSANSSSNSSFGGVAYDTTPNSSNHFLFDESQNSSCSNSNSKPRWVYEVMEYMKKKFNVWVLFILNPTLGRAKQVKIVLPDGPDWLFYLFGSSKCLCAISISCITLFYIQITVWPCEYWTNLKTARQKLIKCGIIIFKNGF